MKVGEETKKIYDFMGLEKESNKLCKILYWFGHQGERNILMKFGNMEDISDCKENRISAARQSHCLMSEGELEKN